MSELESKLTDKLTLKGNRAKLLHVRLWHHTYYTSSYLIDEVTGELYACEGDELIAIKEQGYLRKEMAEEKFLEIQTGGRILDPVKRISQHHEEMSIKELPKIPTALEPDALGVQSGESPKGQSLRELSEQNKETVDEATKMLMEQQRKAHQQAILQWNLKRRERKQLEKDLLNYQVSTVWGGCPTDQEIEQARFHIISEHMKRLRGRTSLCQKVFRDYSCRNGNGG